MEKKIYAQFDLIHSFQKAKKFQYIIDKSKIYDKNIEISGIFAKNSIETMLIGIKKSLIFGSCLGI